MSIPSPSSILGGQLLSSLAKKSLHPSTEWLSAFLATQRPSTPLPALLSTATFRLLASDVTTTLSTATNPLLPTDVQNPAIREFILPAGDIVVQILDVEDMSRSRWEQIEALEALERGEGTRGKQIVRLEAADQDEPDQNSAAATSSARAAGIATGTAATTTANRKSGPHKVLLQDTRGNVVTGIEQISIQGINLEMGIGAKILLRGCTIARGVVLLEPQTVAWLGGRIEALHKNWIEGKKDRLNALIDGYD